MSLPKNDGVFFFLKLLLFHGESSTHILYTYIHIVVNEMHLPTSALVIWFYLHKYHFEINI